jgi:hypothetical protein
LSNDVLDDFTGGARQPHAGRPAAHYDKGQPLSDIVGIGLAFSRFERLKDAPANIGGILDGLQPRRERLPFVMAEVMKSRTAGDDQSVVIYFAVGQDDSSAARSKSTTSAKNTLAFFCFRKMTRRGEAMLAIKTIRRDALPATCSIILQQIQLNACVVPNTEGTQLCVTGSGTESNTFPRHSLAARR